MHESVKRSLTEVGALTNLGSRRLALNREALYTHPGELAYLAKILAGMFYRRNIKTVVAAASPSLALATCVAHALGEMQKPVCMAYAMKTAEGQTFISEHHRPLIVNTSVLVVDDFVTDAKEALAVIEAVATLGGHTVGFGAIAETIPHFQDVFGKVSYRHVLLSSSQLGL